MNPPLAIDLATCRAPSPTPAPRSGLLLGLALLLTGCAHASVPPQLQSYTLRSGIAADFQNLEVRTEENDGPHPGVELMFSGITGLDGTTATMAEIGGDFGLLGPGGDLSGNYWRAMLGARRTWNMDRPLRQSIALGGSYATYDQRQEAGFDIRGPGVYLGGGLEYFWTPKVGVGLDFRGFLQYLRSDKEREFTTAGQFALHLLYRF